MRRSRETTIVRNEDGIATGVAMKADFTAEHEWGIDKLNAILGVKRSKLGIAGRTIINTEKLHLVHGKKGTYLYTDNYLMYDASRLDKHHELHSHSSPLTSAWSDEAFCVCATKKEDIEVLEEIYKRAQKKDVAIGLGGNHPDNPFDRPGLGIYIISRMSKDLVEKIYNVDLDWQKLQKADKKTKVAKELEAKFHPSRIGFSVKAAWAENHHEKRGDKPIEETTQFPVVYWLRFIDYCGWHTVEEIRQWIQTGTGIIQEQKDKAK